MISTLSEALAERGYDALTDVQTAVTAPELAEADLLVSAQTGSGKTVGFGLAIAPTLLGEETAFGPAATPMALIIAPTRELAQQVQRELIWLYAKAGARIVSCIGGMDARNERRALDRGAHIVVGTPGRLRDHIERGNLDLTGIKAIVLDEADEMLDLGFREDLEFMLGEAPQDRRTLLFSATVPRSIAELAKNYQRDAKRVIAGTGGKQHADISYQAVQVASHDSEHAIINLLRFHDAPTAIVFANTRAAVARLTARFANRGFSVVSLSGELSQDERSHALQAMRDGRARVCVATDVAARGIDLPNLELVIHADLPTNTEALLHRSGRTGRAGRKGISALIVPDKASKKAQRLLKWAKINAEWVAAPSAEEILAKDETRLLDDPAWEADLSESETAFATTLLASHSPEKIAAACLRLYRAKLSAPEELNTAKGAREHKAHGDFGPSAWISLSIGRNKGAEPRWLLPMLCRAGKLEKSQIGKIRVQDTETFVELQQSALSAFLDQLDSKGALEDGLTARKVDGTPDLGPPPRGGDRKPGSGPKGRSFDKGPRPPRKDGPRDKPHRPKSDYNPDAAPARKPRHEKSSASETPGYSKSSKPAHKKPHGKPRHEGSKPAHWEKSDSRKSSGKPSDKPRGKPTGKPGGKPSGKPYGKPAHRSDDRPAGKPGAGKKPGGRPGASDTSKRMQKPGGKPRKPNRKGGDAMPYRKK